MMYAKIIDGELRTAPNPIRIDGEDVFTTNPTAYGYKPIVHTSPQQTEGMYPVFDGWVETETDITQSWRYEPIPEDDEEAVAEDYETALGRFGV